jgi:hypothetical protein
MEQLLEQLRPEGKRMRYPQTAASSALKNET